MRPGPGLTLSKTLGHLFMVRPINRLRSLSGYGFEDQLQMRSSSSAIALPFGSDAWSWIWKALEHSLHRDGGNPVLSQEESLYMEFLSDRYSLSQCSDDLM